MLLAIGSLGLPVGTRGWVEAVAFAQEHPVRAFTDPLLFWTALIVFSWVYGRYLDRKEAEKAVVPNRFTDHRFTSR